MNLQECPRARRLRALAAALLAAALLLLAAGCSNPEKAKAEHLQRGEALLKERRWQEASLEFRNAIQIDGNLAAAHWGLAQAYRELGRDSDFGEELQRAVKLDPNNMEARTLLAQGYLVAFGREKRQEFIAEAERLIGEMLAKDPRSPDAHILSANVIFFKGGPDAAKQAEEKIKYAISLDPQRMQSYMGLAKFYQQTGRNDAAESVFRQAISINDRSSLAHGQYAIFLVQTGRNDDAEAEFRKAVDVEPDNRDTRKVLASYYLVNQRYDKAEEAYKAWAQLDWDKAEGRARLADYYATVGRFDDAASLYQDIVNNFKDYTRGRYRLGEISLQRGDVAGADAQAGSLLKANEKDIDALFLRARIFSAKGKTREAIANLKTVLDQEPRSKLGLYFMSDALYRDGQYEQARARAGELERYYPDFFPAKLLQIQINLDSRDYEGARRMADELLKKLQEPDQTPKGDVTPQVLADIKTNAYLLRGKASIQAVNPSTPRAEASKAAASARADFDAARQAAPNSPLPYVNLADAAGLEGKIDEAQQHIEHALSLDRTNQQALTALINLGAATNRLDQSRSRVEQLAAEQPSSAPLQYLVGQSYRTASQQQPPDAQRAEAAMKRAVELDPEYMAAYTALAEIYVMTNQADRAVEQYNLILKKRPDDFTAYRNLGLIESQRGRLDEAEKYYRGALSIRPDEFVSANNLAAMYADHGRGNAEEAIRLAQDVVRRYPNEPGFADTLGWVYYRKGLYRDAVEQLQRAVSSASKRGGDNSLYRWHLGKALADGGDRAAARRELQRCQELYAVEQSRPVKAPTQTPIDDVRRTLESLS
ncbi:MAG TPA: tetratricopeptide repeat protein [Pyrinomonadaceae bacterium]|jgi:tetratricopeptide (TPR) repeat protein|nr:tetratricopeptide repeat protein [Pyrinomonadaceae bacterium]